MPANLYDLLDSDDPVAVRRIEKAFSSGDVRNQAVDANPEISRHADTLTDGVADLAPTVWSFMQERQGELPDPQIPDKRVGLFARLFSG